MKRTLAKEFQKISSPPSLSNGKWATKTEQADGQQVAYNALAANSVCIPPFITFNAKGLR